jgi:hypothetical protein
MPPAPGLPLGSPVSVMPPRGPANTRAAAARTWAGGWGEHRIVATSIHRGSIADSSTHAKVRDCGGLGRGAQERFPRGPLTPALPPPPQPTGAAPHQCHAFEGTGKHASGAQVVARLLPPTPSPWTWPKGPWASYAFVRSSTFASRSVGAPRTPPPVGCAYYRTRDRAPAGTHPPSRDCRPGPLSGTIPSRAGVAQTGQRNPGAAIFSCRCECVAKICPLFLPVTVVVTFGRRWYRRVGSWRKGQDKRAERSLR